MREMCHREIINEQDFQKYMAAAAILMAGGIASAAHAADSVNVAFFLEWATPNQIAKVDKVYDDARVSMLTGLIDRRSDD